MRFKKSDFRRLVKGHLEFSFGREQLTSYAGLELLGRFVQGSGFLDRLRALERRVCWGGDIRFASMVLLFVGMLVVGGRRLRHVRYLKDDPLVSRFAHLRRVPSERTLSRFLKMFSYRSWPLLDGLNFEVVEQSLKALRLRRLTLDIDGSVVQTGLAVERAERGFNPHHRKNLSYYPITIQVAQTGQVIAHRNRSGNVHDSRGSARFLLECVRNIRHRMGFSGVLETRMDAAFFQREILELCDQQCLEYALRVPMMPWLNLRDRVARVGPKQWKWVDRKAGVQGAFIKLRVKPWDLTLRVALYRKKVHHRTRKNFQLDLFHPDDGTWEYSAVATNKSLKLSALWNFYNGRGSHEKTYAELRAGYAYGYTPTNCYAANTAWQKLNVLTHNLVVAYQLATTARSKSRTLKRTAIALVQSIKTHRFTWINKAARLINRSGRHFLSMEKNTATEEIYTSMSQKLSLAA